MKRTVYLEIEEVYIPIFKSCGMMLSYDQFEELIRCKECKYNNGGRCSYHDGEGYKWVVDDEDYCSCAERKKE